MESSAAENATPRRRLETAPPSKVGGSGAARARHRCPINPRTALPLANTLYRVLVQLDPDNVIAETRESNNVIDTRIRVRRF